MTARGLVLGPRPRGRRRPASARRLTARAGRRRRRPSTAGATVLLATGGETARAVLDSARGARARPRSAAPAVDRDVTHAGRAGRDHQARKPRSVRVGAGRRPLAPSSARPNSTDLDRTPDLGATMTVLPRIAVTMGDAAGIGPEVIVRALLDPECAGRSNSVVVGDAARLRRAAELRRARSPTIVTVSDVSECEFVPGRINVIDLGLIPEDLPFGELSPVAGDAAYHYVRVASELAMAARGAGHLHRAAQQGGAARRRAHLPRAHRAAGRAHRHRGGLDDAGDPQGAGHPRHHPHRPDRRRRARSSPAWSSAPSAAATRRWSTPA